jgi:hypothetical protein
VDGVRCRDSDFVVWGLTLGMIADMLAAAECVLPPNPLGPPWFTIAGTHMFITSGTRTVMIQHHLHHVDGSTTTAPHCL